MVNSLAQIAKMFDSEVQKPLREAAVGRKLIPRNNALSGRGIGHQSTDYYTFNDLSAATMDYNLPETDEDTIDVTTTNLKMLYMKKSYKIPRTAYESFRMAGIPIDADAAVAVADLIAVAENTLFVQGWAPDGSTYKIKGLYQSAGNTEGTADAFSTYGNPMNKVALASAKLMEDNVLPPYNLVLNEIQYNELLGSHSTAGISEWDQVMKMINANQPTMVGQIFMTTALEDTYGILCGIGSKYFDFIEAQPLKNELGIDSAHPDTGPILGTLYEAVVPRIKKTEAVCSLTGI